MKRKMIDTTPTLHKIKRAASHHTRQRFCSTFNSTLPHPSPPTTRQQISKILGITIQPK